MGFWFGAGHIIVFPFIKGELWKHHTFILYNTIKVIIFYGFVFPYTSFFLWQNLLTHKLWTNKSVWWSNHILSARDLGSGGGHWSKRFKLKEILTINLVSHGLHERTIMNLTSTFRTDDWACQVNEPTFSSELVFTYILFVWYF